MRHRLKDEFSANENSKCNNLTSICWCKLLKCYFTEVWLPGISVSNTVKEKDLKMLPYEFGAKPLQLILFSVLFLLLGASSSLPPISSSLTASFFFFFFQGLSSIDFLKYHKIELKYIVTEIIDFLTSRSVLTHSTPSSWVMSWESGMGWGREGGWPRSGGGVQINSGERVHECWDTMLSTLYSLYSKTDLGVKFPIIKIFWYL